MGKIKKPRREQEVPAPKQITPKYVKNAVPAEEKLGWTVNPLKDAIEKEKFNKKFILTENTRIFKGVTLYQIQAVRAFDAVQVGELGGWVSDDRRLSHYGNCWISEQAAIYEQGHVAGDAWATQGTVVRGNAKLYGKACIFCDVVLEGNCRVEGDTQLGGSISMGGKLYLKGEGLRFDTKEELTAYLKSEFEKRRAK